MTAANFSFTSGNSTFNIIFSLTITITKIKHNTSVKPQHKTGRWTVVRIILVSCWNILEKKVKPWLLTQEKTFGILIRTKKRRVNVGKNTTATYAGKEILVNKINECSKQADISKWKTNINHAKNEIMQCS